MKKQYQVTLICATGQYRPVSCIINRQQDTNIDLTIDKNVKQEIQRTGIQKICIQRGWTMKDLKKYSYTKAKVREYDKEKIAQQKKENYDRIKEEKYASGEWQRPKNK